MNPHRFGGRFGNGHPVFPSHGPGYHPQAPLSGDPGAMYYGGYRGGPTPDYIPRRYEINAFNRRTNVIDVVHHLYSVLSTAYREHNGEEAMIQELEERVRLLSHAPYVVGLPDELEDMDYSLMMYPQQLGSKAKVRDKLIRLSSSVTCMLRANGGERNATKSEERVASSTTTTDEVLVTNEKVLLALYQDASSRYTAVCHFHTHNTHYTPLTKEEYLLYKQTHHATLTADQEITGMWQMFNDSPFMYREPWELDRFLTDIVDLIRKVIRPLQDAKRAEK